MQEPFDYLGNITHEFKPEIIGVSVRNIDDQDMDVSTFLLDDCLEIIQYLKKWTNAPIVLGGSGYSMFPEPCLDYLDCDMGIQGDGEEAFNALLNSMAKSRPFAEVPGLHLKGVGLVKERSLVMDLDQWPLPSPDDISPKLAPSEEFFAPIQTRRGCPMKCSYCSTPIIEGCSHRRRSADMVMEWLGNWVDAGFRNFFFVDNTFNMPPFYAKRLCSKIIEEGLNINWRCIIYPAQFDNELARLMAEAGCSEVSLGFESGDNRILNAFNKRFNTDAVIKTSEILRAHGIKRMGFLMLGGPGETKESVVRSLEFADKINLDSVKITKGVRIYPDTELARIARDKGLIDPEDNLLFPKFYMERNLSGWLEETIEAFAGTKPNWIL